MKRAGGDTIKFESRSELGELLKALETYKDEHPNSKEFKTVKELYKILDVMEFEW